MRILSTNKGVALLMVLWVLILLMVIASEFAYSMRTGTNITRNFKETTQAYYIAVAGLHRCIREIVWQANQPKTRISVKDYESADDIMAWRTNTDIPAVSFGEGSYKIKIDNESGKININHAGRGLLRVMLNAFELDDREKDVIVDSILDWRDPDHNHRINGAEDDYYLSLQSAYECKDGDFDTVNELLLVRGVTHEIVYNGIEIFAKLVGGDEIKKNKSKTKRNFFNYNVLNINAMTPRLWRIFPEVTDELVAEIVEYRKTGDFISTTDIKRIVGPEVFLQIAKYITMQSSPYYTVSAVGQLDNSRIYEGVTAVIHINSRLDRRYQIVQWIDMVSHRSDSVGFDIY